MPVDMKEIIADAVEKLLFDKKVKRLTVKDIVAECNITRQAFYYHFEDIPELLRWILERNSEKMLQECFALGDAESALRYLMTMAISMRSHTQRGLKSNYGEEIEKLLREFTYRFSEKAMDKNGSYRHCSDLEKKWIIRYHSNALIGILMDWTDEDSKHMDENVHVIHQILQGTFVRYKTEKACFTKPSKCKAFLHSGGFAYVRNKKIYL